VNSSAPEGLTVSAPLVPAVNSSAPEGLTVSAPKNCLEVHEGGSGVELKEYISYIVASSFIVGKMEKPEKTYFFT
jgi:hypothetical protein